MYKFTPDQVIQSYNQDKLTFAEYLDNMQVKIISHTATSLEFDIININCSFANAFRRILIAEIPTLAIHNVTIRKYRGVLAEEIVCHRLGLIPLLVDPTPFEFVSDELNEKNTLTFTLKMQNKGKENITVYSDDIKWKPVGNQEKWLTNVKLGSKIPITKLGPGDMIDFEMNAVKNVGKEHAKWSPVCPASYRLHPLIQIGDFYGEEAERLKKTFCKGVIEIENNKAVVKQERLEKMCMNALRYDEFKDKVLIGKKENHYIFNIETVHIDPLVLLKQSILIFKEKCKQLREEMEEIEE